MKRLTYCTVLAWIGTALSLPLAARAELSVFGLFEGLTAPTSGRFEVRLEHPTPLVASGSWSVSASGDVSTVFDMDADFVNATIRELLESGRFENAAPAMILLMQGRYEGNAFSFPLVIDLLDEFGIAPGLPADWVELVGNEAPACRSAAEAARAASLSALAQIAPVFARQDGGPEEWVFPIEAFDQRVQPERQALVEGCEGMYRPDSMRLGRTLRFERRRSPGHQRLSIFFAQGTGNESPYAEFELKVDETARPASEVAPAPHSFLHPLAQFRLKVHECRGLPWEYVTFAAGNFWTPPQSYAYVGPTLLSGRFHWEAEVLGGVKTWSTFSVATARAERLIDDLARVTADHPASDPALGEFRSLLETIERQQPTTCLRLGPGPKLGPTRVVWKAKNEILLEPGVLPPASSDLESVANFLSVSFPASLVLQYEAVVSRAREMGFESRRDSRYNGLYTDELRMPEGEGRIPFGLSLSLRASRLSSGNVRLDAEFLLGTPCLGEGG